MRKEVIYLPILLSLSFLCPQKGFSQAAFLAPNYLTIIQQRINSCLIYPQEAKSKGWEGITRVRFTLANDGRVKEIDIAESSGYPLLDAAVILAVRDASPYPFPDNYPEEELDLMVPINYARPEAETPEAKPTQKPAEQETRLLVSSNKELTDFIDLAIKNNQPTQVAREEIELAQLKVTEARRNLFPAVKLTGYTVDGKDRRIPYEEWENKIQLDQPLFYLGRLGDSFRQARVNLEITRKNYDRLKFDIVHKSETAYYNLVIAKMHLKEKEALKKEAQELASKMEKLFAIGMTIPVEVNSARSSLEQIQFQIDSVKHDLHIAELTFKQVLNILETPNVETDSIEPKKLNLDLDSSLKTALHSRPEIYLSELLVRFNDYGQRIESKKVNAFTVDFTSSYGDYHGHFKTEPWKKSTNWYAGFKFTKPFGASTLTSSYTKEKTEPRFGQTAPTEASTFSGELNLFDNLKRLSDRKKSDVDLFRSLSDFDETFKTIAFEVQDAFLNYQKALLQLNTAESEMKFRRSQIEVTKIRAMVGETSLSNALEVLLQISDAQTKYMQALGNYHIFLANLKKATGYGLTI